MKRDSFPALIIVVLVFGLIALLQATMGIEETNGCFWDRDTLAYEASGYPGITEIITGRFDRFPPLYYEMRLNRVTNEIESDPDNLDLYDDAGVACDRIGRHDEAIEWMASKRIVLNQLAREGNADSEQEYHYLANLGTMHIHRWLSSGANREDLSDVERSHELIAAAIELNPDAHFGRERYQLLAIKWILDGYLHDDSIFRQPTIIEAIEGYKDHSGFYVLNDLGYADAVEGFSGLISLGNAWESIDIFYALSLAFREQKHSSLNLLAQNRIAELAQSGKRSLSPDFEYDNEYQNFMEGDLYVDLHEPYLSQLSDSYYPEAREEADNWVQRRNKYALDRLQNGEHPDTHASFWDDWVETTSPPRYPTPYGSFFMTGLAAVAVIGLFLFLLRRVLKHRSLTGTTA